MTNYEKMLTHQRGWQDGAGGRMMDKKFTGELEAIYGRGYTEGRAARASQFSSTAETYGVTVHEIKMACLRG